MCSLFRVLLTAKVLERLEVDDVETFFDCYLFHLIIVLGLERPV